MSAKWNVNVGRSRFHPGRSMSDWIGDYHRRSLNGLSENETRSRAIAVRQIIGRSHGCVQLYLIKGRSPWRWGIRWRPSGTSRERRGRTEDGSENRQPEDQRYDQYNTATNHFRNAQNRPDDSANVAGHRHT